jgi:AcrR family transcriptional regulator
MSPADHSCQDVPVTTTPQRSYGGQTADERVAARRERLIRATTSLLAERGESHTTMTGICAAAGLTERYFYESFRSRDEALVAALDATARRIAAAAVEGVQATAADPVARVRAGLAAVIDLVVEDPAAARVVALESTANAALRARQHELLGWFSDIVSKEALEIFGADAWPQPRARLHAMAFVAGLSELVAGWLLGDVDITPDELLDLGVDLFTAVARR